MGFIELFPYPRHRLQEIDRAPASSMESFRGRVVVITGAGSGIGRATALEFSGLGADLVLADIAGERAEGLAREIERRGGTAIARSVDVTDRGAMGVFAREVVAEKGRVDVLVNNAGVGLGGEIKDTGLEEWEWIVNVNYWGVVHGIHFFLPGMIERRAGHIVNVASANGFAPFPFEGPYASTKFAVLGLTEVLRAEVSRFGVGVTAICPGLVNTGIMRDGRLTGGCDRTSSIMHWFQRLMARWGTDPRRIAGSIPPAIVLIRAMVRVPPYVVALDLTHRFAPFLYRWVIMLVCGRRKRRGELA